MRYYLFTVIFISTISAAFAQISREEYIDRYQLLAIEEMNRSGIPASITMAQACLESGNGNSILSQKSNNHFGIKCKSTWTGKTVRHDDDEKNECFRKYNTVEESFIDHSNFLMDNPRYFFLFQLPPDDYVGWAHGLKKAGYATASDYGHRLIKIIEEYQLYRLDYKMTNEQLAALKHTKPHKKEVLNGLVINPFQSHQITLRNDLKTVVANAGDTYEILAQEFGIKAWELYNFNDQPEGYIPQKNEIIYIEAKHRKASRKAMLTHRVETGETMHYISQLYGLKLKPLYKRNNMKAGEEPRTEEIIFLRNNRR
ncbi:MAG TPA: glucosaminidase domain-containing protein [Draconibacterium sp.]|nr:glucosaminidase domain-containing protein [Draconibacterium sp.]HRX13270.1 glucosaminidase domain-containing protein [Draconibacterium sp.]